MLEAKGDYGAASLGEKDEDDDEDDDEKEVTSRGEDISKRPAIRKELLKLYQDIEKGFSDQYERANEQLDYWDVYNCKITAKQFYNGNARIFVPIVKNAVDARKTRFLNQVFPQGGRYIEVVTQDGAKPEETAALLEHYIRKSEMRTKIMPALMKAGDIEGQYNILVSWSQTKRHVTWRTKKKPKIEGTEMENPAAEEVDDIKEEVVEAQHPKVEVVPDSDILVLPQTADAIEEAVREMGGSVTVIRRLGKAAIKRLIKEGAIRKDEGEQLIEEMDKKTPPQYVNQAKQMVDAAGIKGEGGKKHALIYRTWTMLKVKKEERLCEVYFGSKDQILGCRINPLWCDRVPLLSVPIEKVANVFKGRSKVAAVADLQYAANDAINEAWDSAAYALMPVVMTDPEKNPRTGSMILSMSAIWETSPKDTQVVQFPQLWQHGFEMVNACKNEVSQTLNVSPAAITQGISPQTKGKQNQAQIAQEQQVDILTTADSVTVVEGLLNQFLALIMEMDHQYRDEEITVRAYGKMGLKVNMQKVPPVQMDRRYQFRWYGVEQARNAQQVQQQISALNVVSQMAQQGPEALGGYKLKLAPWITQMFENVFGPRLSSQIWETPEDQMPLPAQEENILLELDHEVVVHPEDEDEQHIAIHKQEAARLFQEGKDTREFRVHIWLHMQQMKKKMMAQQQQAMGPQQGPQQGPQKQQKPPRPGAMNKMPRGGQNPAGMIPRDQMKDPGRMPGKMGGGLAGGGGGMM